MPTRAGFVGIRPGQLKRLPLRVTDRKVRGSQRLMVGFQAFRHRIRRRPSLVGSLFATAALVLCSPGPMNAQVRHATGRFQESFEDVKPGWSLRFDRSRANLARHLRSSEGAAEGERCEFLEFRTEYPNQRIQLAYPLPAARAFDDLVLRLRVKSAQPGISLWFQLVFPRQIDPRTGESLTVWIPGTSTKGTGNWEELSVRSSDRLVTQYLQLRRQQTGRPLLDTENPYVNGVMLALELTGRRTEISIDDLEFGPVLPPARVVTASNQDSGKEESPVAFNLGRLTINNQPMFLRMTPYHGESVEALAEGGFNVLWIPRLQDDGLLRQIRQHSLWAVAMPPQPRNSLGEELGADEASLVPFTGETLPILGWYLGTRLPLEMQDEIITRSRQIRSADRRYRRPLLADVTGGERVYSRHVSMLGLSRHNVNSSFTFQEQRDWLSRARRMALPGTFSWTWVQTEPNSSNAEWRRRAGRRQIVLDAEQIRLHCYSALAAGVRGIGFWKTNALVGDSPGQIERQMAIRQLNLELSLIEDWLSTGRLDGQIPFSVEEAAPREVQPRPFDFSRSTGEQVALGRLREQQVKRRSMEEGRFEAAMIRGQWGVLLLPIFHDPHAQLVPGRMVARNATFVVPGVEETASAYQLTTTGIRSLKAERGTGGMRVVLDELDQTAIILLTTDHSLRDDLEARIRAMAKQSARTQIALVRAKAERVAEVISRLPELSVSPSDSKRMLQQVSSLIEQADSASKQQEFAAAGRFSRTAAQLLRLTQRAYWDEALWNLASPVSSPYTTSFQTLPDHWRMMAAIGRGELDPSRNLVRSGSFEDIQTMVAEGWRHSQSTEDQAVSTVDLFPEPRQGKYCLRLQSQPVSDGEQTAERPQQVTVVTPPFEVHADSVLHISGYIQIPEPLRGSLDGFMILDSLTGASGAIRMHRTRGWQRFEMLREIHESGPFELTFVLAGHGEVRLDDLRVIPIQVHESTSDPVFAGKEIEREADDRAEGLIERIGGIGSIFGDSSKGPGRSSPQRR